MNTTEIKENQTNEKKVTPTPGKNKLKRQINTILNNKFPEDGKKNTRRIKKGIIH